MKKSGMLFNFITVREGIYEMKRLQGAETCSEKNGKFWVSFARFGVVMVVTMKFTLF
jgi:hypothetical protein